MNHQNIVAHLFEKLPKVGVGDFPTCVNSFNVQLIKSFSNKIIRENAFALSHVLQLNDRLSPFNHHRV